MDAAEVANLVGVGAEVGEDLAEAAADLFPGAGTAIKLIEIGLKVAETAPTVYKDLTNTNTGTPTSTNYINAGLNILKAAVAKKPIDPQTLAAHEAYVLAAQDCVARGIPVDSPTAVALHPELAQGVETLF